MSVTSAVAALALAALVLAVIVVVLARGLARAPRAAYLDEGPASAVFASARYRIRAKPDLIERAPDGSAVLVERKSRVRGLYPSDRAQIVATALAVRAHGIPLAGARLECGGEAPHRLALAADDATLARTISRPLAEARLVAAGGVPAATPSSGKCRACAYARTCPHAIG